LRSSRNKPFVLHKFFTTIEYNATEK